MCRYKFSSYLEGRCSTSRVHFEYLRLESVATEQLFGSLCVFYQHAENILRFSNVRIFISIARKNCAAETLLKPVARFCNILFLLVIGLLVSVSRYRTQMNDSLLFAVLREWVNILKFVGAKVKTIFTCVFRE